MEAVRGASTGRAGGNNSKPKRQVSEARREYLRNYYLKNRDRALAYQREYNRKYKKKARPGDDDAPIQLGRPNIRRTFTPRDLIQSSAEKTVRMIDQILRQERYLTM